MPRGEFERVRELTKIFAAKARAVDVGIGDDAAVFGAIRRGERLVATVDAQVEGTHFRREWLSFDDVGHRAMVAAASDVFAMGARPILALSALGIPQSFSDRDFRTLARAGARAARDLGIVVVGGNMTRSPVLTVTTTVLGLTRRPLLRAARPGDRIFVLGTLGLARAGLLAFEREKKTRGLSVARRLFRRPELVVPKFVRRVSGAIDVSDGLAQDLGHVALAAKVGIRLDERALRDLARRTGLDRAARELGEEPLELLLQGGEDYALLLFAKSRPDMRSVSIGEITKERGIRLLREDGSLSTIRSRGFDHFAPSSGRSLG